MNFIWSFIFQFVRLRRRVLHYLCNNYFHELKFSIPIGNNYWANLLENDSFDPFSEIFICQEYADFIPNEPILKIIDIGANYGYFSLWLQAKLDNYPLKSLMIEASPKCKRSLQKIIDDEKLSNFKLLSRVVGDPIRKFTEFYDRPFMAGSFIKANEIEAPNKIETLQEVEITNSMPPPYDLIKCDIEGAEWEFLVNYTNIIKNTKYLVMEWHSWHLGGGGITQIEKQLKVLGYIILKSSPATKAIGREGEVGILLAQNKEFKN